MPGSRLESTTIAHVRRIDRLDVAELVCSVFQELVQELGFASVLAARMPVPGGPADALVFMNTRPPRWTAAYVAGGGLRLDPTVRDTLDGYQPLAWTDVGRRRRLDAGECALMLLAGEHGMDCGYVVPIFETGGHSGIVSVAGTGIDLTDGLQTALSLAAVAFYNRLSALRRRRTDSAVLLTEREVQVLRWIAGGKSDWQIGQILDISAKTVNYHVENVKRKFDVSTRMQAVVAAVRQGKLPDERA